MELGLVSIQRNRGPWLVEWFAFHYLIGFRKFYFYAHLCDDTTHAVLHKLRQKLDITALVLSEPADRIQLMAYQHACNLHMNEVDWMGFIDGDEFLFPSQADTMQEALAPFEAMEISAVAAYNYNFGSSGHIAEPPGLITENYTLRAPEPFLSHRRVKSLVKGHQKVDVSACSNVFATPLPTVDELLRPVTWGYMPDYEPSYQVFRFNHYVCQSREYYLDFKRNSGHADAAASAVRDDDWWQRFDTNEVEDHCITRFIPRLKMLVAELNS